MKRYFLLAAAAIGMMAACSKTEVQPASKIDDSTIEAVKFNLVNAPKFDVLTRGAGAVEAWNSQALYILGYERNVADYTKAEGLIPNVKVAAPNSGKGALLVVEHETDGAYGPLTEPYYYQDNAVYDFFGYYVDNAAGDTPKLDTTALGLSLKLTIDGTQDIMAAKANPTIDVAGKGVPANKAYSAWAARRDVQPTLKFEHKLARFRFFIVAGSKSGETTYVTSVKMNSKRAAVLNLVPNVLLESSDSLPVAKENFLTLMAAAGQPVTKAFPHINKVDEKYAYEYDKVIAVDTARFGESIMVVPGEIMHKLYISTEYANSNVVRYDLPVELRASDIKTKDGKTLTSFEAGYQYDVILTIYGPEKVEITANLTDWKDGGYEIIDPDKDEEKELENVVDVKKAEKVTDQASYESALAGTSYFEKYPYAPAEDAVDRLPWIVIQFAPVKNVTVKATNLTTDYVAPEITFPAYSGEEDGYTLLTLCGKELGLVDAEGKSDAEAMKGMWLVEINDYSELVTIQ